MAIVVASIFGIIGLALQNGVVWLASEVSSVLHASQIIAIRPR